jgi:hypothetical protein
MNFLGRCNPISKALMVTSAHGWVPLLVICLASCMTDPANPLGPTAFSPYITADGKHSFRFVASSTLPSNYNQADLPKIHEQLIANELGKRQYCPKGYQIVSKMTVANNIIYEGVCT